jgi:hypothetical protein
MANTTSGTYIFDKTFSIDEVIQEAYERIGLEPMSGNNMKTARRSLNILFSEWGNRGLHYWEIAVNSVTLIENQNEYIFYRSPGDGTSSAVQTTLSSVIDNAVTTIPLVSVYGFPTSGTIQIDSEEITYTGISLLSLTGATRGANSTVAASHVSGTTVQDYDTITYGVDDIEEASFRNIISSATNPIDSPLTKINRSAYQAFSNKLATGQPTQYWVQRFIDRVTLLYTQLRELHRLVIKYFIITKKEFKILELILMQLIFLTDLFRACAQVLLIIYLKNKHHKELRN